MIKIEILLHESSGVTQKINQLVSKAFGYQPPHQFFDDFPIWSSNQVLNLGIFDGEKLVSHVGIHFAEIFATVGKCPVALIGAVATDEAYRGKGLSSALMKEALRVADERKCDWTFLWGSEHEFYQKMGFYLAGSQCRVLLATLPGVLTHREPKIKTGITEEIFKYLLHRKTGMVLKPEDREWFFAHKTVKWFYLEEPFAFVAFERGLDLGHLVHEWGGDEDQIKTLLSHVLSYDPQAQILGAYDELVKMGAEELSMVEEFLCLARPGNAEVEWDDLFWISGLNAC
jgi:predicted N-acetyltransferase YhbS